MRAQISNVTCNNIHIWSALAPNFAAIRRIEKEKSKTHYFLMHVH